MHRKYRGFVHRVLCICTKYMIEKAIDRPTKTPLCGFAVATHEPLKFYLVLSTDVPVNRSFNIPRCPWAFEFLENFGSNSPSPGRKAVQMPPPPGKLPDYCFNFLVG